MQSHFEPNLTGGGASLHSTPSSAGSASLGGRDSGSSAIAFHSISRSELPARSSAATSNPKEVILIKSEGKVPYFEFIEYADCELPIDVPPRIRDRQLAQNQVLLAQLKQQQRFFYRDQFLLRPHNLLLEIAKRCGFPFQTLASAFQFLHRFLHVMGGSSPRQFVCSPKYTTKLAVCHLFMYLLCIWCFSYSCVDCIVYLFVLGYRYSLSIYRFKA